MADGARLCQAIEGRHPAPFASVDRDTLWHQAEMVDELAAGRPQRAVELLRLIALLGPRNGHTAIHPLDDHPVASLGYPLDLHEFDDGVFVVDSADPDLVGSEILRIGEVAVAELLQTLTPLVAYDNASTIRARRPSFATSAMVLAGLGAVPDERAPATFRLRGHGGSTSDVVLHPVAPGPARSSPGAVGRPPNGVPHHWARRHERHWVERTGPAVHVAYNVTLGDMTAFAAAVEEAAASDRVAVVVLDLRHNGGGNNRTYRPLLEALVRLSARMPLRVLISRSTFSAAMQLVVDLSRQTPAVFVGEPTGGSPNQYGDATLVDLPQSGLNAFVATIAWMTAGADDDRLTVEPDLRVPVLASRFFGGHDDGFALAVESAT